MVAASYRLARPALDLAIVTPVEIAQEVAELEKVEALAAGSSRSLNYHEIAAAAGLPEDRTRFLLSALRKQERLAAMVSAGDCVYSPGPKCRASLYQKPVEVTVRRRSTGAEIKLPEDPAPREPIVTAARAPFDPKTPGALRTRDGTAQKLLEYMEGRSGWVTTGLVALHTGVPLDKADRSLYYIAHVKKAIQMRGAGLTRSWARLGTTLAEPLHAEEAPIKVEPRLKPEDLRDLPREVIAELSPAAQDLARAGVEPEHESRTPFLLPVVHSPDCEALINADGDVLILDGGQQLTLQRRHVRALVKLVRRLDSVGLLDDA